MPSMPKRRSPKGTVAARAAFVPADPATLGVALDPALAQLRAGLAAHRRRLWLRRAVRRGWMVLAAVAVAELLLVVAQRLWPLEGATVLAAAIPVIGLLALLVMVARARPSLGETALAVDAEGGVGDAIASALAFAGTSPTAAVVDEATDDTIDVGTGFDVHQAEERFVRRQRRDALGRLHAVDPRLFKPRFAPRPALVSLVALALVVPAVFLPNPQDAVIAQNRAVREEAEHQAERIDEVAKELDGKGADANDPRTQLAEDLRELAERLRDNPSDLDANLAQLGAVEDDVRSQLDPSNEQRAASIAALSRALSRASTGNPQANAGGDPKVTREDLHEAGEQLDEMTQAEREELARELAGLQGDASQADAAAGAALRDAVSSLSQGDTEGAREALDRLGEALDSAAERTQVNRDLSTAASNLQDARRELANAGGQQGQAGTGQQGTGQQGNGQQGQAQGNGQGAQGSPGASQPGQSGQTNGSPCPTTAPVASGETPGPTPQCVNGQGQGQGQGQGSGSLGGGGSNANHLGTGSSNGQPGGPTNPNRPSELGGDLGSVFAPFDRLGKPGDPSYIAGSGGDGQTQQGSQQGQGSNNGSYVPYGQVYSDFQRYALTTLDRSYVPISVKDYVRDYFTSLDPQQ